MVDCGVFLLIYAEIVIHNSELFLLKKKMSRSELSSYFLDVFQVDAGKPREMRTKIVRIIDQLAAQPVPVMESDDSEVECLKVILIPKRKSKRKDRIDLKEKRIQITFPQTIGDAAIERRMNPNPTLNRIS